MDNLNAEQVKKALAVHSHIKHPTMVDCSACAYIWSESCREVLATDALALINSQEQRIKEFTQANEQLSKSYDHLENTKDELLLERAKLSEKNEKLQRLCELRDRDHNDALDLLYKAEAENEGLKNELEGLRGIMISYIKVFGGESASRVPIGKKLYFTLDENFSDILEERVCECTVTAVGRKGFWVSSYVPPQDDAGEFSAFDEIGKTVFFTHEDALRQLKGEEKNERQST